MTLMTPAGDGSETLMRGTDPPRVDPGKASTLHAGELTINAAPNPTRPQCSGREGPNGWAPAQIGADEHPRARVQGRRTPPMTGVRRPHGPSPCRAPAIQARRPPGRARP